jgi:SnoaL-like domain
VSVETLLCKMECQDLIFRYAVALDSEAGMEALGMWCADGRIVRPDGTEISGTAGIRKTIESIPLKSFAPRILTNVVVTPTGENTAEGFAYLTLPGDMPKVEWHFEFRKSDTGWRISCLMGIPVIGGDHGTPAHAAADAGQVKEG